MAKNLLLYVYLQNFTYKNVLFLILERTIFKQSYMNFRVIFFTAPYSKNIYTVAKAEINKDCQSWRRLRRWSAILRMRETVNFVS